jgi:hypothetical protein
MSLTDMDRVIRRFAISTMTLLFIVIGPSTDSHPPPASSVDRIAPGGHTGADGTEPAREDREGTETGPGR